jgi:hypothetical protein
LDSVSIIIPSYNHADFLPRAIDSSLRAGRAVHEVIVVDDASSDESLAVAMTWQARYPRVRVLRNEANRGVVESVRRGFAAARSQHLLFRAADDVTLPGFVDPAVRLLDAHPSAAYCLGDTRFFGESEEQGRTQSAGFSTHATFVAPGRWNDDFGGNELSVCSAIIRRSALAQIGGFDPALHWVSDWAVLAELGSRHGLLYFPKPACAMRMSPTSYNSAGSQDDSQQLPIFSRLLERFATLDDRSFTALNEAGILDFFATALRRIEPELRSRLPLRAAALLDTLDRPVPAARERCGMPAALRQFLAENETMLRRSCGVALVGAGGHTRLLLQAWRKAGYVLPRIILVSGIPHLDSMEGIPVRSADDPTVKHDFEVIVISSKSYETALAELAATHWPTIRVLRIWT